LDYFDSLDMEDAEFLYNYIQAEINRVTGESVSGSKK
jgi:hypothetical protein